MATTDNVLMIGWEYPPHNSGGLGVACQGLTQAMAEQNAQIYFTLPYQLNQSITHMNVVSCTHPGWQDSYSNSGLLTQPPFSAYASEAVTSPRLFKQPIDAVALAALPQSALEHKVDQYAEVVADQAVHQQQFDIIHAHDWMSLPAAAQVKRQTGKPVVAHIHSTEYDRIPNGHGSQYIHKTEYQGMMMADRVIAVSYYTKKILTDVYHIPADKIEVVHNGMMASLTPPDPGRHHFANDRPVVAFMGRLTGQKGPHQFLWLAEQLIKRIPDVLIVIAGNGDMYHELLLQTAQKGLSSSVLFSGFIRDHQREKLLDRADIFVMPSLSEPFGLVALEAAERHTPVIISKTSGVSEVLPSAVAVDFWDIDAMTTAIEELLKDDHQRQHLQQQQLKELEQVTWHNAAERVRHVYRKAFTGAR
jgi:glycogen(starch) synthase